MKRNCRITQLLSLVVLIFFFGMDIYGQGGGSAVPFLRISPDARSSGMGEVGTAIADDINAIYWNPAGLGFHDYVEDPMADIDAPQDPYRQLAIAYSPWLPQFNADLFYSYITYGQYVDALDGTIAANFIFMNLGEFKRTDEVGHEMGTFISNDFTISVSYGTIIADDLGVGVQVKYIQSNLAPNSQGESGAGTGNSVAFDLSMLWKPRELNIFGEKMDDFFSIGFNLQNIGPKITYKNIADPLPTTLRIGAAFNLVSDEYNDLTFAVDFSKLLVNREGEIADPLPKSLVTGWDNPGAEWAFGLEYWYEDVVALRAGYFTEPSMIGDRKYWNFGAGFRYLDFRIDLSYINTIEENHPLANTMRFSLLVDM